MENIKLTHIVYSCPGRPILCLLSLRVFSWFPHQSFVSCLVLTVEEDSLLLPHAGMGGAHSYTHTCVDRLPFWGHYKLTWNASFTDGKHLYSTATWPLVIAAAFCVPVILRHLGLTQRGIAPTSPRHSVTVKGHRQIYWNHRLYKLGGQTSRWLANESSHARDFSKKNESLLIIAYIGLLSLNSLICSSCLDFALVRIRAMKHEERWDWKEDGTEKQVIKR